MPYHCDRSGQLFSRRNSYVYECTPLRGCRIGDAREIRNGDLVTAPGQNAREACPGGRSDEWTVDEQ
jgi:hypothetical protein